MYISTLLTAGSVVSVDAEAQRTAVTHQLTATSVGLTSLATAQIVVLGVRPGDAAFADLVRLEQVFDDGRSRLDHRRAMVVLVVSA